MYELLETYLSRCGVWGVVLTLGAFGLGTFVNRKT